MSVFVLVAKEGAGYAAARLRHARVHRRARLATRSAGSSRSWRGGAWWAAAAREQYCPANPVTREQMAVFVLRTLDPTLNPPACGTPVFTDVPASSPFCRWIEELARRGVVSGCGGGNYCPTAP